MPITIFENLNNEPLTLIVEPSAREYEIAPLAKLGIRYPTERMDRSHHSISGDRIRFWCDVDFEVDLVLPTACDKLLWDLCVKHGCCGSVAEGGFAHVTDLLPANGIVTAEIFAAAALQAEGDPAPGNPSYVRSMATLRALFVAHIGANEIAAETLTQNLSQPFEAG